MWIYASPELQKLNLQEPPLHCFLNQQNWTAAADAQTSLRCMYSVLHFRTSSAAHWSTKKATIVSTKKTPHKRSTDVTQLTLPSISPYYPSNWRAHLWQWKVCKKQNTTVRKILSNGSTFNFVIVHTLFFGGRRFVSTVLPPHHNMHSTLAFWCPYSG